MQQNTSKSHTLLSSDELHRLLAQRVTLEGQSTIHLNPLGSPGEAADALSDLLTGLEEAYHDDFAAFEAEAGARNERRRLRSLRLAIDLFTLLADRL